MQLCDLIAEVENDGVYNGTKRKMMVFYFKLRLGSVATDVGEGEEICGVHSVKVYGVDDA